MALPAATAGTSRGMGTEARNGFGYSGWLRTPVPVGRWFLPLGSHYHPSSTVFRRNTGTRYGFAFRNGDLRDLAEISHSSLLEFGLTLG